MLFHDQVIHEAITIAYKVSYYIYVCLDIVQFKYLTVNYFINCNPGILGFIPVWPLCWQLIILCCRFSKNWGHPSEDTSCITTEKEKIIIVYANARDIGFSVYIDVFM